MQVFTLRRSPSRGSLGRSLLGRGLWEVGARGVGFWTSSVGGDPAYGYLVLDSHLSTRRLSGLPLVASPDSCFLVSRLCGLSASFGSQVFTLRRVTELWVSGSRPAGSLGRGLLGRGLQVSVVSFAGSLAAVAFRGDRLDSLERI